MNYRIVVGLPSEVESTVQSLLIEGWKLNGPLFPRIDDGYHLVVQSMYLPATVASTNQDESSEINGSPIPSLYSEELQQLIDAVNNQHD